MDRVDSKLLSAVDDHTRLAGSNRMEILLFSLGTREHFGINVFKVKEVCATPPVTPTPNMPLGVEGLISLRGAVLPVLSLARILRLEGNADQGIGASVIVTEYSRRTLGFAVQGVERIVAVDWETVRTPEAAVGGAASYISAITTTPDGRLVSIVDVESVLADTLGEGPCAAVARIEGHAGYQIFFADDSAVARRRIAEVLDQLGVRHRHAQNGREAWDRLQDLAANCARAGRALRDELSLVLVDAEMPEMDGYVLTRNIKADARFEGIPVVMHSSLSSEANRAMGRNVGVDAYVAKFDAGVLADTLGALLARSRTGA
ncbi:MAG: fused signal transduction protein/response regulator [Rhodocyclales bacterium CG_4_9_14_3_um_filter_68_10]|nr:MAG: fused signal transduction protein/response regulator [Rhodocyclales bacterium CG_4_9_14_3_um_filter_68_10]